MSISSVIVETLPAKKASVIREMKKIEGVEIHVDSTEGKIIATIEAQTVQSAMDIHKDLWEIPGVAGVQLAYHYFGDSFEDASQKPSP